MSGTLSGTAYVGDGAGNSGSDDDLTIALGGYQYVGDNSGTGTATSTTILSGGYQYLGGSSGVGTAIDPTVSAGGYEFLGYNGGTGYSSGATLAGGLQIVGWTRGVGYATSTTILSNGQQYVGDLGGAMGSALDTTISAGGYQDVGAYGGSGTAVSTTVLSGGEQDVGSGGFGFASATLVETGGLAIVFSSGTISGGVIDGGDLQISGAVLGPVTFAADTNYGTLNLAGEGSGAAFDDSFTAAISGFTGTATQSDVLVFDGGSATDKVAWSQSGTSGTLVVETSAGVALESVTLDGAYQQGLFSLTNSAGDDQVSYGAAPPCFVRATRIATRRGEVAVEDLVIGDLVATASGGWRPVRWIGWRGLDLTRHPEPKAVRPVRVRAGAFGEGLPRRDLWLSPGHNVACEGALVPISSLCNGVSVAQIAMPRVEYWHVELDAHDVLLAEGLPAESYLDTGNRCAFANGGACVEAHPDFRPVHWAETCLPLVLAGSVVVRARARLLARLFAQGYVIDDEPDAYLMVDGRRVEPVMRSRTQLGFALIESGRDVMLHSRRFVPAHVMVDSDDERELGLCVGALHIDGAPFDLSGDLGPGWHAAEMAQGRFERRWTTGAATLPAGARQIVVEIADFGSYLTAPHSEAIPLRA